LAVLIFTIRFGARTRKTLAIAPHWYCVETLNVGLALLPSEIDRETPRATMESLVRAVAA